MGIEARISGMEKAPWLKCRGCRSAYWAQDWHCQRCHCTFDRDVSDWHVGEKQCVPPNRNGMVLDGGVWRS